ncbi:Fc.00g082290.m01.CDS01 [Cosmosporella sp. VM-42]
MTATSLGPLNGSKDRDKQLALLCRMCSIAIAADGGDPSSARLATQDFIDDLQERGEKPLLVKLFNRLLEHAKLRPCLIPEDLEGLLNLVDDIRGKLSYLPSVTIGMNAGDERSPIEVFLYMNSVTKFSIDESWAIENSLTVMAIITGGLYGLQGNVCYIQSIQEAALQVTEIALRMPEMCTGCGVPSVRPIVRRLPLSLPLQPFNQPGIASVAATQQSATSQPEKDVLQWAICNLVALKIGSGSDSSDAGDFIKTLSVRKTLAFCITARDDLLSHLGTRVQGLPSAKIRNQVSQLQDQVKTSMDKAFVKFSAGLGFDQELKPIDLFCWLKRVGNFDVPWPLLDLECYDLYMAVLLGVLLGRLGTVIEYGGRIESAIPSIIQQYERDEGLLPHFAQQLFDTKTEEAPKRKVFQIGPDDDVSNTQD